MGRLTRHQTCAEKTRLNAVYKVRGAPIIIDNKTGGKKNFDKFVSYVRYAFGNVPRGLGETSARTTISRFNAGNEDRCLSRQMARDSLRGHRCYVSRARSRCFSGNHNVSPAINFPVSRTFSISFLQLTQ